MDSYRKILSRLSCVPFKDFEQQTEGALVRAAFVVEGIQVKVSQKSQKKFAILMISDGLERFELPVWSELFEEKAQILKENQLLYAVLQLEKKNGALSLSCKAIEDLTALDEAKVKMCDDLYDRLKMQAAKSQNRVGEMKYKGKQNASKPAPKQEESKHLVVKLDADRLRFTDILSLKDLFREFPGKSTVELQFFSKARRLGVLSIDAQWGVNLSSEFLEKLKLYPPELIKN